MMDKTGWYTEEWADEGSAISLKIKKKLHDEQTPYQRIEIFETESFGRLMTLDGLVMVTDRDNFIYHEMMSHPAILAHPDPKRVLIIGGGDCGTLREVLKHREVQHLDQVELDERVTRVAETWFPELCESNNDARAHLHFTNGLAWVEQAESSSYDIIIVDSTDPVGPAAELFSESFYQNCHRALGEDGILIAQSESPLFHAGLIKSIHKSLKGSGFKEVRTHHFPQCTYPSGWWSSTMACRSGFANTRPCRISTRYFHDAMAIAAATLPNFLREDLAE